MTPRWPPLPRRLPRALAPLRWETCSSYLGRLAAANRASLAEITRLADPGDDDPASPDRLAALTGYSAAALQSALPELRYPPAPGTSAAPGRACPIPREYINDIRPPCRHCAASAGADPELARVWATHDVNVCVRHQLWIGEGNDHPQHQPGLTGNPGIVRAQLRHQRILRRRGRPASRSAFRTAQGSWASLITIPGYARQRNTRLARLSLPAGADSAEDALISAADYPEIVTFTAMLASPYWRSIALARTTADNQRFHLEFRRRLAPDHHERNYPRFLFWLRRDLEWHPGQPDETCPAGEPPGSRHQPSGRTQPGNGGKPAGLASLPAQPGTEPFIRTQAQ